MLRKKQFDILITISVVMKKSYQVNDFCESNFGKVNSKKYFLKEEFQKHNF